MLMLETFNTGLLKTYFPGEDANHLFILGC